MQRELDRYCEMENNRFVRRQEAKLLPSGAKRSEFYRNPGRWGGRPCLIPVPDAELDRLLKKAEEEAYEDMEYVDEEHKALADEVYAVIGKPVITLDTAWLVFKQMIAVISADD